MHAWIAREDRGLDPSKELACLLYTSPGDGKCLHYYVYFIEEDLGLRSLRVPTGCAAVLPSLRMDSSWPLSLPCTAAVTMPRAAFQAGLAGSLRPLRTPLAATRVTPGTLPSTAYTHFLAAQQRPKTSRTHPTPAFRSPKFPHPPNKPQ